MPQPTTPTFSDRLLRSVRAIIRAEFPGFTYRGIFEFAIQKVAADGSTADASPTDTTLPLPSIVKIPIRSSLLGESVALSSAQIGARCLVAFVNGDPSRPVLVGVDPSTPTSATVDASATLTLGPSASNVKIANGTLGAARTTDVVNAGYLECDSTGLVKGYFPGTPAGLVAANAAAGALVPSGFVVQMTQGQITGGSSKTVIG